MGKKVLQKEDKQAEKQLCNICLTRNANANLNCDHKFCYRCIIKWAKKKQTCPNCRREIRLIISNRRRVQFPPKPPFQPRVVQRPQITNNVPVPRINPRLYINLMIPSLPMWGFYPIHPIFYPFCFFPIMPIRN